MPLDATDTLAIQDLLNRYCYNADYNPPEAMREVFTPDALWEVPAMGLRCEGIEAIIAFFSGSRSANSGARHVISNILVEGEGDRARASAYLQVVAIDNGQHTILSFGRYQDELVRTAAGWRFSHRCVLIG
jgi:ketosteroid isomerase-like protein